MKIELKEDLLGIGDEYIGMFNHTPNTYTLDKCFNIFNSYIESLMIRANFSNSSIKKEKLDFILSLIGIENCTEELVLLIIALLTKKEKMVYKYSNNPLRDTVNIMDYINSRIIYSNSIAKVK